MKFKKGKRKANALGSSKSRGDKFSKAFAKMRARAAVFKDMSVKVLGLKCKSIHHNYLRKMVEKVNLEYLVLTTTQDK